jgi:hypothetical protein
MSVGRLERIEAKIDGVIIGQAEHTKRLDKLEIGQEELNDKVKQIAEGRAVVLRELDKGFVSLHAVIHERLEPLKEREPGRAMAGRATNATLSPRPPESHGEQEYPPREERARRRSLTPR